MFMSSEEIMEALAPMMDQMVEFDSNLMKFVVRDKNEKALVTIVLAREDKAPLLDRLSDLVDDAYDAGIDAEVEGRKSKEGDGEKHED